MIRGVFNLLRGPPKDQHKLTLINDQQFLTENCEFRNEDEVCVENVQNTQRPPGHVHSSQLDPANRYSVATKTSVTPNEGDHKFISLHLVPAFSCRKKNYSFDPSKRGDARRQNLRARSLGNSPTPCGA